MKIVTLFGTRPEIIRLSRVIARLDGLCELTLIHTGQNYDERLSDVFFRDLQVRPPDIHLGVRGTSYAEQISQILTRVADEFSRLRPDRLLILGDTNSGLSSVIAARMGIPVYHMEAGNRCYDDRVPEEINRRIIDHCSNILMPYTYRSQENLIREGIPRERIFVTGNPIHEVIKAYQARIWESMSLEQHQLTAGQFFLVTLHRAENVDQPQRLESFLRGLSLVADTYGYPMLVSVHPRTADKLERFGLKPGSSRVRLLEPLGFFDFVQLERNAFCVLSDSGTVQEECCILQIPNVTLRDVTERPETIECGSNVLAGADPETILRLVKLVTNRSTNWHVPPEYLAENVADTVCRIVLGFRHDEAL